MNRDPSRCDYCHELFTSGARMLHMLDKKMILAEPIFDIHLACAYDLRDELDKAIRKLESDIESSN